MAWYKTGTVAVTNGSKNVTLTGGAALANIMPGDTFIGPNGVGYEINTVSSNSAFALVENYGGSTTSGAAYKIQPTYMNGRLSLLDDSVTELVTQYQSVRDNAGNGLFDRGTVTTPGVRASDFTGSGMYWKSDGTLGFSQNGTELKLLSLTSANWIPAALPVITGDVNGYVLFAPVAGSQPFGTDYDRFDIRVHPTQPWTRLGNTHAGAGAARALHLMAGNNVGLIVEINGNIGIGNAISGPAAALDVQRSGTNVSQMYLRNSVVTASMWSSDSSVNIGSNSNHNVFFLQNNIQRWLLTNVGHLMPNVTNTYDIGDASQRVRAIYLNNSPITTSDERRKRWLCGMSEAEYAAGVECFAELGFYQWNEKYETEGDDARWQFGVRAQRVWGIFARHGLVDPIDSEGRPGAAKYGFLCYDRWDDEWKPVYAEQEIAKSRTVERASETLVSASGSPILVEVEEIYTETENLPVLDSDGNQVMELVKAAGDSYGLRETMFDRFLIAVLAQNTNLRASSL